MEVPHAGKARTRVLVMGREVSDFLCPLFAEIGDTGRFDLDLLETRAVSRKQAEIDQSFRAKISVRSALQQYRKTEWLRAVLSARFWKGLVSGQSGREALRAALVNRETSIVFAAYDVFNLHFLTSELVYLAGFIPQGKKVVLAYWGSDLFQQNADFRYQDQEELVNRAASVVVHSPELKVIFLSKFGWHLEKKVHSFLLPNMVKALAPVYQNLSVRHDAAAHARAQWGVSPGRLLLAIGHSAHDIDNHIPIVQALAAMDRTVVDRMHVILPMTYGAEPGYLDAVEEACRLGNLRYTILRNFLSQEEMVGLRYATDILVRLSRFDAFSLSLCESLCAGTVVISATWLPYGYLRAAGIHFRELSAIAGLTQMLPRVLDNLPEERDKCRDNPAKIMHLFEGMHPARSLAELLTV
jgi:hypothetical protein